MFMQSTDRFLLLSEKPLVFIERYLHLLCCQEASTVIGEVPKVLPTGVCISYVAGRAYPACL